MGLADWFETFNSNLRMTKATTDAISHRYKTMTSRINLDFWSINSDTQNSLYVGSYGRGTAIHISDIDVLFVLPVEKYHQYNKYTTGGQSALLQEVKNSIAKTYSTTHMRADGQVIVLEFTDKIRFEIVPCFLNQDKATYTYPDTNNGGSWKVTKPKEEIAEINSANNLWNKNLKRLCRMARAWKDTWDVPMGGLLIVTLAYNFMKSWEHRTESYLYYDWMSRDFFKYLSEQNKSQSYWLAVGSNQQVNRKGSFENKALQCYNLSLTAINYEKDYEWSAKQKWREIYGTKFPS